jgi:hypothetical protein
LELRKQKNGGQKNIPCQAPLPFFCQLFFCFHLSSFADGSERDLTLGNVYPLNDFQTRVFEQPARVGIEPGRIR